MTKLSFDPTFKKRPVIDENLLSGRRTAKGGRMKNGESPAFPNSIPEYHACLTGDCVHEKQADCDSNLSHYSGLTKREMVAAMAMQGICSTFTIGRDQSELQTATASTAVKYADALLAELGKKEV